MKKRIREGARLIVADPRRIDLVASPHVKADFHLGWVFASVDTKAGISDFGGTPEISFKNVRLDLGTFFSRFAKPILEDIQKVLRPIKPVGNP